MQVDLQTITPYPPQGSHLKACDVDRGVDRGVLMCCIKTTNKKPTEHILLMNY